MSESFFERPILNSPYEHPRRHWELDVTGQPTSHIVEQRRSAKYGMRLIAWQTINAVRRASRQSKGGADPLRVMVSLAGREDARGEP